MKRYKSGAILACFFSSSFTPMFADAGEYSNFTFSQPVSAEDVELRNYWVSEKLDGIRALWTGRELRTRKGNKIMAPQWFTEHLPSHALEGELWAGRDKFNHVQKTVLTVEPNYDDWSDIVFMLFDLPNSNKPFEEKYQQLAHIAHDLNLAHVQLVDQEPVESYASLMERLEQVETKKGEGLMLIDVERHTSLSKPIKIKKYMDSEGTVIGYKDGLGKYEGLVGALTLQLMNGDVISVGSGLSDALRKNPPALGEVVTFRYNGYTVTGLPKFARFLRVRDPE